MAFLKVCIVSKFPPIQGGIASKTYWLARGLAEAGVEVHIVTNALAVEEEYRISSCDTSGHLPAGVHIHNIEQETPWHIPYSSLYQEKLLDKVLDVCNKYHIELIDSHYLVPYGITAFLANKITGIPYIIRHGGSDIAKFWQKGKLTEILKATLSGASAIVTDLKELSNINSNIVNIPRYVPDECYFNLTIKDKKEVNFAYVGKINYYWHHKGLNQMVSFWEQFSDVSNLLFLSQGKGKEDFINKCGCQKVQFLDFIPPWEMPSFLYKIDFMFYLIGDDPIKDFSNVVVEAVSCGVKIITDVPQGFNCYEPYFDVPDNIISMNDFSTVSALNTQSSGYPLKMGFDSFIGSNIDMYSRVLR